MGICISHATALGYLLRCRNPRLKAKAPSRARRKALGRRKPAPKRPAPSTVPRNQPPDELAKRLLDSMSYDLPDDADHLDVLISDGQRRHRTQTVSPHRCAMELPADSLIPQELHGIEFDLCCPELVFLQMAEALDLNALIYVGCALCSNFRLDALEPSGVTCRTDNADEPLTTVAKIRAYLNKLPARTRNRAKALKALEHVWENARSPQEIGIAMCVGLPLSLGGHALGTVQLNPKMKIYDGTNRKGEKVYSTRYPDVLVTAKDSRGEVRRVDIEYSPMVTHGDEWKAISDAERGNIISTVGSLKQITLTTWQVQHYETFLQEIDRIRRALGQRKKPQLSGDPSSQENTKRLRDTQNRQYDLWALVLGENKIRL